MMNKFINYVIDNQSRILLETFNQLVYLIIVPILIAILIAIPVGILCSKNKKLSWLIKVLSILQTIPSLVMFTMMIVIGLGIGYRSAITALVIYSILPIVNNTYTAFNTLDRDLVFMGTSMGMTRVQLFLRVELPLTIPMILTGVQSATMICSGSAVLAGLIGAGGLGVFILTGINQLQYHIIIVGAIPSMIITWSLDLVLSRLINRVSY